MEDHNSVISRNRSESNRKKLTPLRILRGCLCLLVLVLTAFMILVYFGFWTSVFLRFFSIHYSRKATSFLLGSWLALWPLLFEKVNKTKVILSGESVPEQERVLIIANHRTEVDWMYLWNVGLRKGCIGYIKYVLKSSLMKLPVFGWVFHIAEFIPVERKWDVDESKLLQMVSTFKDHHHHHYLPLWLVLFPEGTDFTEKKRERSQKYAIENGLPILTNVLLPKTKGFHACLNCLRSSLDAVYDITIAYKPSCPSFLDNAFGLNPSEVHMHIQRFPVNSIPRSEDQTGLWLMEIFSIKDRLISDFNSNGFFPFEERIEIDEISMFNCLLNFSFVILLTVVCTYLTFFSSSSIWFKVYVSLVCSYLASATYFNIRPVPVFGNGYSLVEEEDEWK